MAWLMRRAALLALAGVMGGAAAEILRLGGDAGPLRSGLTLAAFAATVLGGLALAALALGPQRWLDRVAAGLAAARGWAKAAEPVESRWAGGLLVALALASYVFLVAALLPRNTDINNDQGAYLGTAAKLRDEGGLAALPGKLVRGEFKEANRHPLYIGLLSLAPSLEAGKRGSAILGGLSLALFAWLMARQFGWLAAGLFSVLLATNFAFLHTSALVACEGLLILWTALVWLLGMRDRLPDAAAGRGALFWGALGALMGLAYLTKATALPLFALWWLWLALAPSESGVTLTERLRRRRGALALALVAWIAVASPLWIRNVRVYGSPFYNVNSYLLFVDAYEHPTDLAEQATLGEAARRYLATHSLSDMAQREISGLAWEAFIIGRALGPIPLDDSRVLFGAALLALAVVDLAAARRAPSRLTIAWALLCWGMFAWYVPIAAGERFIVPLVAPLLAHAACGATRLLRLAGERDQRWTGMAVAALGAAWCLAAILGAAWMGEEGALF